MVIGRLINLELNMKKKRKIPQLKLNVRNQFGLMNQITLVTY